jgi:protocatechuate 3,4-dioxygenase beta subunit
MRVVLVGGAVASAGLVLGVGAAVPKSLACKPTVSDGGGPFSRTAAGPPRRSTFGRGHVLSGRVLRYPGCTPVRGAFVEIWQESPKVGYARSGRASIVTGPKGRFRFEGPMPASDGGFPPHIHVHVHAGGFEDVVVTHFVRPGEKSARITIVLGSAL